MGAPPKARNGEPKSSVGRDVIPGVGVFERPLSPRATQADLWAAVEAVGLRGEAPAKPGQKAQQLSSENVRRYRAFLRQAREYYSTVADLSPVSKPLTAYYFGLNMAKAFLVVRGVLPPSTKITHGMSDSYEPKSRYYFAQERVKVWEGGVFPLICANVGSGHCYPSKTVLRVKDLLPHLVDAYDLYADSTGNVPRLIPVRKAEVLVGGGRAWLRLAVQKSDLQQRSHLGPENLVKHAVLFGSKFSLVQDRDQSTATYESRETIKFGSAIKSALPALAKLYDESGIARRRGWQGGKHYIEISKQQPLLAQEGLILIVLHHLSNMVRYRPEEVEKLQGSTYSWLFTSWVDRASENLLLSLASRITFDEHVILA